MMVNTGVDIVYHRIPVKIVGSHPYWAVPVSSAVSEYGVLIGPEPDNCVELVRDWDDAYKILALRNYRDEWRRPTHTYGEEFACGKQTYLVLTDSEADRLWELTLHREFNDLECDYRLKDYIDYGRWMDDAKEPCRAKHLAKFDHEEIKVTLEEETFYIYRLT